MTRARAAIELVPGHERVRLLIEGKGIYEIYRAFEDNEFQRRARLSAILQPVRAACYSKASLLPWKRGYVTTARMVRV